jgi:mycothiol synthase
VHEARPDPSSLRALAAAAEAVDGIAPLAEQTLLAQPGRHLVETVGAELVAYATSGDGTGEVVVAPDARRRGLGRALLTELLTLTDRVWAHGDLPAAQALAAATGLVRGRELLRLRRPSSDPLPEVTWPAGITVRAFEPGRDEPAWLALNASAFADHPEQGRWTAADLAAREAEPWFDPAGLFLACRGDQVVGFHWTKVDGGEGEVYVVGVDPAEAGGGLGRALTVHGLRHLAHAVEEVLLYVDGDNVRARGMYERLGFRHDRLDVTYVRG